MDYELAKKLEDAGFPQEGAREQHFRDGITLNGKPDIILEKVYYPTLSELIDACGEKFASLMKSKTNWLAMGKSGINETGKTPFIAVANLYLALNKK